MVSKIREERRGNTRVVTEGVSVCLPALFTSAMSARVCVGVSACGFIIRRDCGSTCRLLQREIIDSRLDRVGYFCLLQTAFEKRLITDVVHWPSEGLNILTCQEQEKVGQITQKIRRVETCKLTVRIHPFPAASVCMSKHELSHAGHTSVFIWFMASEGFDLPNCRLQVTKVDCCITPTGSDGMQIPEMREQNLCVCLWNDKRGHIQWVVMRLWKCFFDKERWMERRQ